MRRKGYDAEMATGIVATATAAAAAADYDYDDGRDCGARAPLPLAKVEAEVAIHALCSREFLFGVIGGRIGRCGGGGSGECIG